MLKKVMIKITSKTMELEDSLFDRLIGEQEYSDGDFSDDDIALKQALAAVSDVEFEEDTKKPQEPEDDTVEICTEGRMRVTKDSVSITYDETELTGMDGAKSMISFMLSEPGIVTMTRTGCVNTSMTFEENKRHICSYNTPYMPFELCVRTMKMENALSERGELRLEYVIEIRGSTAEHTKLFMQVRELN